MNGSSGRTKRPTAVVAAAVFSLALIMASCGDDDGSPTAPAESDSTEVDTESAPFAAQPPPMLIAGATVGGQVEIDGTVIDYFVAVPGGFEIGATAPVVLALPPGGQGVELTERIVTGTYEQAALSRGWVVVSPAAPDGVLYFQGSESLIPGFMEWVESWVNPEGDGLHLLGVSNGGISAFRIAAENPGAIRSLVVFPGFPRGDEDKAALDDLRDVPVRMFVGENDGGWVEAMQDAADRLTELGGDAVLEIVPGEGHIISTLSDGERLFDELNAVRTG